MGGSAPPESDEDHTRSSEGEENEIGTAGSANRTHWQNDYGCRAGVVLGRESARWRVGERLMGRAGEEVLRLSSAAAAVVLGAVLDVILDADVTLDANETVAASAEPLASGQPVSIAFSC